MIGRSSVGINERHKKFYAEDVMNRLIKELIKCAYVDHVVGVPALTSKEFRNKINKLRQIEVMYPDLQKPFSPLRMVGFEEDFAFGAYGKGEWKELSQTLDLIRTGKQELDGEL